MLEARYNDSWEIQSQNTPMSKDQHNFSRPWPFHTTDRMCKGTEKNVGQVTAARTQEQNLSFEIGQKLYIQAEGGVCHTFKRNIHAGEDNMIAWAVCSRMRILFLIR